MVILKQLDPNYKGEELICEGGTCSRIRIKESDEEEQVPEEETDLDKTLEIV